MLLHKRFKRACVWRDSAVCLIYLSILALASSARAQTPEEHASHHPGASGGAATPATMPAANGAPGMPGMGPPAGVGPPAGAGGMMAGMSEMMKGMGKPPPKELYPSLMGIEEFSPEKRREVSTQADERMRSGTALLAGGLDQLNQAVPADDFAAMQTATAQMRQGLAQFESGIAARRALAEGTAPRDVSLQWFRNEMNLTSPLASESLRSDRGLSTFHLFTMALLIVFTFAMLAMYYFKMRRAAALFGRIEPDEGSPPPGSSPPLSGGGGPSGPTGGKGSPSAASNQSPSPPPQTAANPASPTQAQPATSAPPASAETVPPLKAKWLGKLCVASMVSETPFVKTFRLQSIAGGALPFTFVPGQFLNVAFGIGGARMNRSYSISSSPNEREYVDLTIKREDRGAVSRHILDLIKVGATIEASGPVGKFTFSGTEANSIVLLSAGVGITPMMSIARYLTEQSWPGDIFFIYCCRNPSDFIFEKAIAELEVRNPKLHVVVTMTKPAADWKGPRGRLSKELLIQVVPDLASRRIHACGPPTMMDAVKTMLAEVGVSAANLKTEAFGAVKPAPAAPGTSAKPTTAATGPLVAFSKSNKSANVRVDLKRGDSPPKQSILELSEELSVGIDFSCRIGTCGVCKVKMTSGEVDQEIQDALDEDDKKSGVILACQAKPNTDVTVEA